MPQKFDIKVEIVLDDKDKKYFPGDSIQGSILLTPNQSHTLQKLWLAWTGRIQVQPKANEKATHKLFDECWKLCSPIFKSSAKSTKNTPLYHTAFVPFSENTDERLADLPVLLELSKNKTVGFAFEVKVPEMALPSSTGKGFAAHRIVYFLEAFTGTIDVFYRQKVVPVYEVIDVYQPELMMPQKIERIYSVLTDDGNQQCTSSMQVIVPCQGQLAGTTMPISMTIQSDLEITRKQGISVSLLRTHEVIVNGRTFSSFVEPISRTVKDLQLITNNGNIAQTIEIMLQIPQDTVPTISIESSKIMSVSYYIRVLVYAHSGIYVSQDYQESQFLSAELPFIIGTFKPDTKSPTITTTHANTLPPLSPILSAFHLSKGISGKPNDVPPGSPSLKLSLSSKTNGNSSGSNVSTEDTTTIQSHESVTEDQNGNSKKERLSVGKMFKRSSSGRSSGEDKSNKRGVFSNLWSYRRKPKAGQEPTEDVNNNDNNHSSDHEHRLVDVADQAEQTEEIPHDISETAKHSEIQTERVIHHRPFLDSDSEEESDDKQVEIGLQAIKLNKPDEINEDQQIIKVEKPHTK
ncbi:hypothetical protein G6F46_010179 [Rhizopus delemar]|uniref:Arrestin C-terminal-like domain-containing protein n=2 Tax=Rhizopus TaxID=4842 RepID=A0A9P6YWR9_9FUNG|nr:hypothetical protein G6F55_009269 [Rhizopus delemar]KAG1544490.1 hypothetical protein G6F51_006032 [Rhizopus arrhizus]KAG1497080.1 hypothetical protein G6F54_006018 [Rhizopus delemar]KAG1506129.1 hypothetical protein G6F53_009916 [Rhizopus delemar]KAG1513605.1 hypothetical protein G6F52_010122 [Rhizopus delemar]